MSCGMPRNIDPINHSVLQNRSLKRRELVDDHKVILVYLKTHFKKYLYGKISQEFIVGSDIN